MLGRPQREDKARWVHTANMLALQVNMNRRKGSKSVSWQELSPYDHTPPKHAPKPVTEEHLEQGRRWAESFTAKP